jgi:CMP-N-acetylneuraminic acid synthetase
MTSKRLPLKNMQGLFNKRLFFYALDYLIGSKYIDTVLISTDNKKAFKDMTDKEIRTLKKEYDIKVWVLDRDGEIDGEDYLVKVYQHAVKKLSDRADYYVCVTCDSIIKPLNLDNAIEDCVNNGLHEYFTVNNKTMMKNGALNIISREAVLNGMVAGYTKINIGDYNDIHTKFDLMQKENQLKFLY